MSFLGLPKEIRLQIWALAYFAQPPRLVALRTIPHDQNHDENTFCPRYSPNPAPTIVNVCHEGRAEAYHQARKADHIIRLPCDQPFAASEDIARFPKEFYFRFETDIFYLPFEDTHVDHYDDSPEIGFLPHFLYAEDENTRRLQNIAITKVVFSGFHDGSVSNILRYFPDISCVIMMSPKEGWTQDGNSNELFVRAAQRIIITYIIDKEPPRLEEFARALEIRETPTSINVEFATLVNGMLEVMPKQIWKDWSTEGCDWATTDKQAHFMNFVAYSGIGGSLGAM